MRKRTLETVYKYRWWCSFCYEPRAGEKWGDCLQGGIYEADIKQRCSKITVAGVLRRVIVLQCLLLYLTSTRFFLTLQVLKISKYFCFLFLTLCAVVLYRGKNFSESVVQLLNWYWLVFLHLGYNLVWSDCRAQYCLKVIWVWYTVHIKHFPVANTWVIVSFW